jgi:hypothetical protein
MDLSELTFTDLSEMTNKTTDKDVLRKIAETVGATFSGNTGIEKLKEKIHAEINLVKEQEEDEEDVNAEPEMAESNDPVMAALKSHVASRDKDEDVHIKQTVQTYSHAEMLEMDAAQVKDDKLRRNVIRAQALRLRRIKLTNLDPDDAMVPGMMVTCYSKYTGKVSKFIPFDEESYENGYHVPQIIYDDLKTRTYNMRKEVKKRGSSFGIKEYKTVRAKKFAIEDMKPLSDAEIKSLAQSQEARGAIDRSSL